MVLYIHKPGISCKICIAIDFHSLYEAVKVLQYFKRVRFITIFWDLGLELVIAYSLDLKIFFIYFLN